MKLFRELTITISSRKTYDGTSTVIVSKKIMNEVAT